LHELFRFGCAQIFARDESTQHVAHCGDLP
jgi:hypothetical protein